MDVTDVTKFDRNDHDLEEFLLLCMVVAGKVAHIQARKLAAFIDGAHSLAAFCVSRQAPRGTPMPTTPFGWLQAIADYSTVKKKDIRVLLENMKLGQYARLEAALLALLEKKLNLRTCTLEELRAIPGIGPKTARMFVLHTRRDAQHAVLDVHILRFMREELKMTGVPRNTPPEGPKYAELEKKFIAYAQSIDRPPADLDMEIWNRYARKERP